jgi:antitoxin (DNA-binding transcriptional repressor) of toxin-antitoxin stability system
MRLAIPFVTTRDYLRIMKVVGVKELKARLSEYLRMVRAGETVLVTDRDDVVAELRPARRGGLVRENMDTALEALAEAGEVTRAAAARTDWQWAPAGLGLEPGTVARLLDAERDDVGERG